MYPQHVLQVSRPTPGGSWGVWPGGFPGPHPGGRLRGLAKGGVSRPTPKGGLPAHTWGVSPGSHLGVVFIPACTEAYPHTADGHCFGQYASYWNAFLLKF